MTTRTAWIVLAACLAASALAAGMPKEARMGLEGRKETREDLKKRLSPMAWEVTQEGGTEPPFENEHWNRHEDGIYVDAVSGEPLFSSKDKFDSGTGWPSFTRPISAGRVREREEGGFLTHRVEVRSGDADSHLGHVFDDGPAPTLRRYCINSAALRFVPAKRLKEEGYGSYEALFAAPVASGAAGPRKAVFAAGCFWGVEAKFSQVPGVLSTRVGYTGGRTREPSYEHVCSHATGHAEAVEVTFDPARVRYQELVDFFWTLHDPTTLDRQGPDVGSQYRSAVFYLDEEQRKAALASKARAAGRFKRPIVTEITRAAEFWQAEAYHQQYYRKRGLKGCPIR